ncbi:hypothetical protein [Burkholderia plantarii]|uniref:hypothetical protein n=1 Tax=Burkholderia plantarii TaxID=41899 RepID=UPI0006D8C3BA|nr:hypothetical protein [Burkholderia plantarii]GLZ22858.1 hypothetical protein Bpla01_63870 [Burkholderia plantarii]
MTPATSLTYADLVQDTETAILELARTAALGVMPAQREALRSQAIGAYALYVRLARSLADASPDGAVTVLAATVAADSRRLFELLRPERWNVAPPDARTDLRGGARES